MGVLTRTSDPEPRLAQCFDEPWLVDEPWWDEPPDSFAIGCTPVRAISHCITAFSVVTTRFDRTNLLRRMTVERESCSVCSARSSRIAELTATSRVDKRNCERKKAVKRAARETTAQTSASPE